MNSGGSTAPASDPNSPVGVISSGSWGRVVRFARFGVVGASGFVVNEIALAVFVSTFGINYLAGAVAATQVSTLWNFSLVELWAFRSTDAKRSGARRLLLFYMVNNAALLLRGPVLVLLTSVGGFNYLVSNLVSLGLLTVVRFAVADNWIWASRSGSADHSGSGGLESDEAWVSIAAEVAVASVPGAEMVVEGEEPVAHPRRFFPIRPVAPARVVTMASGPTSLSATIEAPPTALDDADTEPSRGRYLRLWMAPVAIGVVAIAVRVWNLDRVGFNSDEVVYSSQAALLAGKSSFSELFSVFRAHPLLFQGLLSLIYRVHMSDFLARLLSVGFGLGTIVVGYWAAKSMYGRRAGLIAAAILAAMPYMVVVNRQVLLDGPMVFFATLALGLLARFAESRRVAWFFGATVALGLTFLAKETGILLAVAMYAFVVLTPRLRVRYRDVVASIFILMGFVVVFPLAVLVGKRAKTGEQFFLWQLLRRPNHTLTYYFGHVPQALGIGVVVVALIGLWVLRRDRTWRETLLLCWIVVPLVFFMLWPVKGFQYLLPLAPPFAILAGRALAALPVKGWFSVGGWQVPTRIATGVVMVVVALTLVVPTWTAIQPPTNPTSDAGSGGVAGGREAGRWIGVHTPLGAKVLTIGPSMSNVIRYFGGRTSLGLSVSSNPLHRNPVYEPVGNADLRLRSGEIQYVVWDANSAGRTPTFSAKLLDLARRYHGRVVHRELVGRQPAVTVYEVRP